MSIKRNGEGYPDPTAAEALAAVIQDERRKAYRPLVFICSPYAGDISGNTAKARRYCKFAVERGAIPFASHLLFPQFMDESNTAERKLGLLFSTIMLGKCDQLWAFVETFCGGDNISTGMKIELAKARKRGIPIRTFSEDCEERI